VQIAWQLFHRKQGLAPHSVIVAFSPGVGDSFLQVHKPETGTLQGWHQVVEEHHRITSRNYQHHPHSSSSNPISSLHHSDQTLDIFSTMSSNGITICE
jgi:hypothetical protein